MDADPQLLASAVMNLLNNAFKYTPAGGRVVLRALHEDGRVRIEVEDECGGIPDGTDDPFKAFADRRQKDRTGLGLGLSIARKAVRMHGGDIYFRNLPGKGCVFVIEVPLAAEDTPVPDAAGMIARVCSFSAASLTPRAISHCQPRNGRADRARRSLGEADP